MFGELTLLEFHLMNLTHFLLNFSNTLHIRLSLNKVCDYGVGLLQKKTWESTSKYKTMKKLDVCKTKRRNLTQEIYLQS